MTARTDIFPMTDYDSVVVHGPAGSGKSQHAEAIAAFFKLETVVDNATKMDLLDIPLKKSAVYLTQRVPLADHLPDRVLLIDIHRLLRAIQAQSGPTGATGSVLPLPQAGVPGPEQTPEFGKLDYARTPHGQQDSSLTHKDTNPKDAVGIAKVPQSVVSRAVLGELGLAMFEGARKYGRHNYRVAGVRASVYFDAVNRHMDAWWEGEDLDPDSGLSHITKGIATLVVLRDAMLNDKFTDDRPPPMKDKGWMQKLNELAKKLIEKYPDPKPAVTRNHQE